MENSWWRAVSLQARCRVSCWRIRGKLAGRFQSMQTVYGIFFAVFVVMALTIAIKLPDYLRVAKITKQLRSQTGFLEEQQALLQAIQDSISDGILLIGENGQVKAFNAAALRILSLAEMKESAIRALVTSPSDQGV